MDHTPRKTLTTTPSSIRSGDALQPLRRAFRLALNFRSRTSASNAGSPIADRALTGCAIAETVAPSPRRSTGAGERAPHHDDLTPAPRTRATWCLARAPFHVAANGRANRALQARWPSPRRVPRRSRARRDHRGRSCQLRRAASCAYCNNGTVTFWHVSLDVNVQVLP